MSRTIFPSLRRKTLIVPALFLLAQICAFAQTTFKPTPLAPVPNPCPRLAAGSVVVNPPALFSSHGILAVNFSYQTTTDGAGRTLFCFMTPNGLENPTLHVLPGDNLVITVTNNTPPGTNAMDLNAPNCGATYMDSASMNIHYHGTNTSPVCGQDEVIKTVINSGDTFQYNVAFPANEPPGLYWYHPHIHGQAEAAVLGGGSGAIVVDGIQNVQPAVSGLHQQILVIRDQPQVQGLSEGPGGCVNDVPFQDITVNNVPIDSYKANLNSPVTFTPAVLNVKPGEKQFWRVTNSSADTILDLQLLYDGVPQTMAVVAIDGVPVNSQDGTRDRTPLLSAVTHFRLPTASRVEFIVSTPKAGVRSAQFVTNSINTGVNGDCDPSRPIFNIALAGDSSSSDNLVISRSGLNVGGPRFSGLATEPIAKQRLVYFSENTATSQFYMTVFPQTPAVFNPNMPPAIIAAQGSVEEWVVQNRAQENHEFHIHQIHFLVESQNNFETNGMPQAPSVTGQYLDTVEVPGWDGNPSHPYPSVRLRLDFRGPDIGTFVFHCHILNHEDQGMMNIVQVVPRWAAWNTAQPESPSVAALNDKVPASTRVASARKASMSMTMPMPDEVPVTPPGGGQ